jgi:enoyl-CoA hydratase/carnithine racemase
MYWRTIANGAPPQEAEIAPELLVTGDPQPAERAERFDLVGHLTEPGQALKRTMERAALVAYNALLGRGSRRTCRHRTDRISRRGRLCRAGSDRRFGSGVPRRKG